MFRQTIILCASALTLMSCNLRPEPIKVTGSSTVYPFTKAVADAYAKRDGTIAPVIESTGTSDGARAFCSGEAGASPDILDASRRLTRAELGQCSAAKMGDIIELRLGLDGIALAESTNGPKLSLTAKDLYLALAESPRGSANTASTWRDVNPALPAIPIKVLGPPKSSGTYEMFLSLIIKAGCQAAMPDSSALMQQPDPAAFGKACMTLRSDGAYVDSGEDDTKIVAALASQPNALGIFGYSNLNRNASRLRGVPLNGVEPTAATITAGQYAGSRMLYLYTKKNRIAANPTIKDFLKLYLEQAAPGGALTQVGLVPLPDSLRKQAAAALENEFTFDSGDLS